MEHEFSEFRESNKSLNWSQFKDPISHMCFAGAVIASWALMQEVAASSPFTVITNIFRKKLHLLSLFCSNVTTKIKTTKSIITLRNEIRK